MRLTRGTVRFLLKQGEPGDYESYKHQLGRSLLGLEFLVAADVIKTVALEPTLSNVAVLGLPVLVRTLLSWTLTVEIEGRWPWQAQKSEPPQPGHGSEQAVGLRPRSLLVRVASGLDVQGRHSQRAQLSVDSCGGSLPRRVRAGHPGKLKNHGGLDVGWK